MNNKQPAVWLNAPFDDLNTYKSNNIEPKNYPTSCFDLYSVPSFPDGKPEQVLGNEIGSTKQRTQHQDVLLCKINPRINRVWIVSEKVDNEQIASSEWIIFRQKYLYPQYILRCFQSSQFRDLLCSDISGVGGSLTRARPKIVATYKLPIPPLPEQKVIAEKLDSLLAQVESTKARLESIPGILKQFRQSVLAAAVSGELTEDWRYEKKMHAWEMKRLDTLCHSISDGDHQAPPKADKGVPFLVISNLMNGKINIDSISRWVGNDYYDSLKNTRKPEINDLLYTVTGSFGISVIIETNLPFCFQRHIAIIKPKHELINVKYLSFFLNSPEAKQYAEDVATGTAQKTVSLSHLRKFKIALPNYREQEEIVRRVEELFGFADKVAAQVKTALESVNHLTQSILAQAFSGELTKDWREQNPDLISGENSAAALLERIKAERAKLKSAPQPRELTKKAKKS